MKKLILVEGLDGAGKGTFIDLLAAELAKHSVSVKVVPGLGAGTVGQAIRAIVKTNAGAYSHDVHRHLTMAAVYQAHDVAQQHLDAGHTVIMDRGWWTTTAYLPVDARTQMSDFWNHCKRRTDYIYCIRATTETRRRRIVARMGGEESTDTLDIMSLNNAGQMESVFDLFKMNCNGGNQGKLYVENVDNNGTYEELEAQVVNIARRLVGVPNVELEKVLEAAKSYATRVDMA